MADDANTSVYIGHIQQHQSHRKPKNKEIERGEAGKQRLQW
jgi:hypothetical protein